LSVDIFHVFHQALQQSPIIFLPFIIHPVKTEPIERNQGGDMCENGIPCNLCDNSPYVRFFFYMLSAQPIAFRPKGYQVCRRGKNTQEE
jgi:hypothetical protein